MRKLAEKDVTFEIIIHPEHMSIEGNVLASGDDAADRMAELAVRNDLESGNEWAWCEVEVKASWEGFEDSDYLGGCSYESEEAFKAGGYFEDMKAIALSNLNFQLQSRAKTLDLLRE